MVSTIGGDETVIREYNRNHDYGDKPQVRLHALTRAAKQRRSQVSPSDINTGLVVEQIWATPQARDIA
jgi:hypothetical protein